MKNIPRIFLKSAIILSAALFVLFVVTHECRALEIRDLFKKDTGRKVEDMTAGGENRAPSAANNPKAIRIATYNLQGVSNFFKANELAGVIKKINADFVILTEAVEGNIIYPNQPKIIANNGKYPYMIFKGNIRIWTYLEKMGNALLSRTKLYGQSLQDLPKIHKESELRGMAAAKTRIAGIEIAVISAHLSRGMHKDERIKQVEYIAKFIKSNYANIPVILAGDFNTTPAESDVLKPITDIMEDGFLYISKRDNLSASAGATIPSNKPDVKFDYIFLSKGKFDIKSFQVYPSKSSDHCPFIVNAELK